VIAVGDVHFVFGKHYDVRDERTTHENGEPVRELQLVPHGQSKPRGPSWVAAWRVEKHGVPSKAYSVA
jgi:hypothetical protein